MSGHGKAWTYNVHGCRCSECRAAVAEAARRCGSAQRSKQRMRAQRVEVDGRLVHPAPWGGHGSVAAYGACGCRCDPCRAANAAYKRRERS